MNTLLLESLSRIFSVVPSAAPANFSLVSQTPTSVTVTWEPVLCMYRNGLIIGYIIRYKELNTGLVSNKTIAGDNMRMFEITGLKPSTQYEIKIAAVNSVGTGPFTNKSIDAMTLGVMQPFTSSTTNKPTVSTTPNNDSGRNSSSTTGGAVAGVVVSLLLIIGAILGILALLWIWRRYTYTHTVHYNTSYICCIYMIGSRIIRVCFQQVTLK